MSRYLPAPEEVTTLLNKIIEEHFPELESCHIMVLMDTKKRKSKGRYVFASIKKMSECERFLSSDNFVTEGYDYLMFVDNNMWENITTEDKTRVLRHELRHCFVDHEAKQPYKVQDHDIQDFREEIRLNQDDPDWDVRVADIMESIYEEK